MTSLTRWKRPSMLSLQRDIEDLLEDFSSPRSVYSELQQLFDDVTTPRQLWRDVDRMLDAFESPPTLRNRIGRLFESFSGAITRPFSAEKEGFVPAIDLAEHDNEYVLKADLPGIRAQDVDVRVDNDNVLTISGERREEQTKKERGYEWVERSYGSFSRSVSLPRGVDASKIEADFRNGVLELHVPKVEEARPRKIPVSREEPKVLVSGDGSRIQATQAQSSRASS